MFGEQEIPSVSSYCYLGIIFTLAGSFKKAALELRHKANRGYHALRKIIDWKFLKRNAIIKLFDSLIKPITMCGCPIWIPYVTGSTLCTPWVNGELSEQQIASLFAKTPCEQLHLSFLKWNLGTHKRTSNCAPLVIKAIKLCIKYFDRLEDMHNSSNLVECAFAQQKQANLPWYNKMAKIIQYWQSDEDIKRSTGNKIKKKCCFHLTYSGKIAVKATTAILQLNKTRVWFRDIPRNDTGTI